MDFSKYLYEQLPAHYRYRDIETEYTLERYLKCLGEFLNVVFKETEDIKDLLDVEKMPSKFLPYYANMFGIKIYDDISEDFQRKLLANIVPILKRKGTRDVIEFVARELTGYDVDITEGNEYAFKTWIQEVYLPLGVKQSVTFADTQTISYRYAGSELTSRFIVYVEIHTLDVESTISEELIRRYLKDLVPSYIQVVFVLNQHLIDEEDYWEETYITVTSSECRDIEVTTDRTYGNVQYENFDIIRFLPEVEDTHLSVTDEVYGSITEQFNYTVNSIVKEGDLVEITKDLTPVIPDVPPEEPTPTPIDPDPVLPDEPETGVVTDLTGAVIMGDSRFVAMNNLGKYFKNMTVDAKIGVSANYFYNKSTGVNRIAGYPSNPPCVIVLLGVNDPGKSGRYFMKNMLDVLRNKYPATPIYVVQEYHMGSAFSTSYDDVNSINDKISEFNLDISDKCKELGMHHIDCEDGLINLDLGVLDSKYTPDGCHLNEKGYDILWRNIRKQVFETSTGDSKDETPDIDVPVIPSSPKDPLYVPDRFTGKITNNYELMAKAYEVLRHYNTVYLYGGIGQVLTQSIVNAKAKQYPSFYTSSRKAKYQQYLNSGKLYWGFDCVNLYKSLLWGWNGDSSKSFGGAKYASNGVPDASADGLFSYCTNKSSTGWDKMQVGEALWMSGHFGMYVGGGKAIECSPRWNKIGGGTEWNGVMLTAVGNCSNHPTDLHVRTWTKHGKMPYIQYLTSNPFLTNNNTNNEDIANTKGTFTGTSYPANITAYYPNAPDGSTAGTDALGNKLTGYPDQKLCAVPMSVPLGSRVRVEGTGTQYDNVIFTATDHGGGIVIDSGGVYHIDLLMKTYNDCAQFGRHKGGSVKVTIGDIVTSSRKVAVCKKAIYVRSGKGESYSKLGTTCTNYRFTVLDDSDPNWVAVEFHGSVGYVKSSLVTIVTV